MKSFWETIKPLIENQERLVRDRESDIHWFEVVTSSVEFEISILTDNDLLNFALNSQSSYGLLFEQIRQFYFRFRGPSGLYKKQTWHNGKTKKLLKVAPFDKPNMLPAHLQSFRSMLSKEKTIPRLKKLGRPPKERHQIITRLTVNELVFEAEKYGLKIFATRNDVSKKNSGCDLLAKIYTSLNREDGADLSKRSNQAILPSRSKRPESYSRIKNIYLS